MVRAGPHALARQARLTACERDIASARAAAAVEHRHVLVPQRLAIISELISLLRQTRERHRADIRALFFARVGNTTQHDQHPDLPTALPALSIAVIARTRTP